ncbi:hypothetical protein PG993_005407 [Apiospora rasikravindrae]|uniref:Uncharacterized protein n=1 Tax=Apiospora rasikravindrae TaxID=990691 RepID=A0ABR1TFI6_9PEZI
MAPFSWSKSAYIWHAIIETPAALSFILSPKKQLPECSPAAELILRQYGGLLLSSVLLSVVMLVSPRGLVDIMVSWLRLSGATISGPSIALTCVSRLTWEEMLPLRRFWAAQSCI